MRVIGNAAWTTQPGLVAVYQVVDAIVGTSARSMIKLSQTYFDVINADTISQLLENPRNLVDNLAGISCFSRSRTVVGFELYRCAKDDNIASPFVQSLLLNLLHLN